MSVDERDEMKLVTGERGQGMSTAILHVSNQMGNEVQTTDEKRQPFGQWILRMTLILVIYTVVTFFVISTINDAMDCLLYTSPSPRDRQRSRMPSSA